MSLPPPIIFILGLHRSGTTLLYQLLAETGRYRILTAADVVAFSRLPAPTAHRNGQAAHEFALLRQAGHVNRGVDEIALGPHTPEEYGFILSNWRVGWSLSPRSFALFQELCDGLRDHNPDRPLLLKNPWDFGNAAFIRARIPTAKFVFLHRNPWHSLGSTHGMMLEYLNRRSPYLALLCDPYRRFVDTGFPRRTARWLCSNRSDLLVRATLWRAASRCKQHLRQRPLLPDSVCHDLRFEDLCADPLTSLRRLFAFLQIEADATALSQRIKRPFPRIAPELVRHQARIQKDFAAYADSLGYDLRNIPLPAANP